MKKQITKSYLQYLGVTEVTEDGKVFNKRGEIKPCARNKQGRLSIRIHDAEKYNSVPKEKRNNNSGKVSLRLHHVVYAWFNSEVPYSKVIHHKDMNYLNNSIDNLEALTPEEHKAKHSSTRELKCRLDIPRSWYEEKLAEVEAIKKKTKVNYDKISNYRAKLRYYDSHIAEAQKLNEFNKDCMELAAWKATFKEHNNKKLWHECCTIEKMVKEQDIEAWPVVRHALEVAHKYFGKGIANETK